VPLKPSDAIDAVVTVLAARSAEWPRLDKIDVAMKPGANCIQVPAGSPDSFKRAAAMSATPYLDLAVRTFRQVLKIDGVYMPSSPERSPSWKDWQRNRMDAGQSGLVDSVLKYGAAYAVVLPGDPSPVSKRLTPRRLTALYQDPVDDEYPMLAVDVDGSLVKLYDETSVYFFGTRNALQSGLAPFFPGAAAGLTFIERRDHDMGVCPVVRFVDQFLLDGEEQYGIVEPLLKLQDRITETTFELLVSQYFAAFMQRYVIGWEAEDEAERMKASAASLWTFKDTDVKVGALPATDLTQYLESKSSGVRDFAAVAQLPAQSMGVDGISNISAEALAGLEAAKDRRSAEIKTSLGESYEQWFRLCAIAGGNISGSDDYESEVRWQDFTAHSYGQLVDGLTKIAATLDVPLELIWEDIPNWSQTKVLRAKQLLAQGATTSQSVKAPTITAPQGATNPPPTATVGE
jgi:hypothetical protein